MKTLIQLGSVSIDTKDTSVVEISHPGLEDAFPPAFFVLKGESKRQVQGKCIAGGTEEERVEYTGDPCL
jgi:hypothetical protein